MKKKEGKKGQRGRWDGMFPAWKEETQCVLCLVRDFPKCLGGVCEGASAALGTFWAALNQ